MVYETFCKNLFEKTTKAICSGFKESIGIIKFEIDRAESEGYFLSAGQGDGGRKNLKL